MSDQVTSPNDGWLTAAEAAKYLKVRSRTLLQWVREGAIKGYALHGTKRRTWRFRIADLDAALGVTATSTAVVLSSPTSSAVLR
jgi:excisionase family DNA binding protein